MQKQDFILQRNAELYKAYKIQFLQAADGCGMNEIYRRVSKTPCSRFFVSEEEACTNVYRMARRTPLTVKSELRRRMYEAIAFRAYERYKEYKETVSLRNCIYEVVNEPAPEFYLTVKSVKTILSQHRVYLRECAAEKRSRMKTETGR